MKISYAVTVCNEHAELHHLLKFLLENKRENDEVVVQCDENNTTQEVYQVLMEFSDVYSVGFKIVTESLNGDFATFKNNLAKYCTGDYIFQIDADEIPHKNLIEVLPEVLGNNPAVELYAVARVNTVEGLTEEHIQKWGWRVDNNGWVNYPDFQTRIYKNSPEIKWQNKVHEVIKGHKQFGYLPMEEEWSLYHPKDIKRQEKQNEFYNTL